MKKLTLLASSCPQLSSWSAVFSFPIFVNILT